jgi:hypothetical protein
MSRSQTILIVEERIVERSTCFVVFIWPKCGISFSLLTFVGCKANFFVKQEFNLNFMSFSSLPKLLPASSVTFFVRWNSLYLLSNYFISPFKTYLGNKRNKLNKPWILGKLLSLRKAISNINTLKFNNMIFSFQEYFLKR